MTTEAFSIGTQKRVTGTFKDSNLALVDPTTVTVEIREPDGTVTSFEAGVDMVPGSVSTGIYDHDFTIAQAGRHIAKFFGTGDVIASAPVEFYGKRPETQ